MVDRVIELVEGEIRDYFGPKYPGGQRAIAEQMHLAQPTLNRLLKKGEGVGLDLVLALRAYLIEQGRPRTIDDILGLTAPEEVTPSPPSSAIESRIKAVEEQLARLASEADRVSRDDTRSRIQRKR